MDDATFRIIVATAAVVTAASLLLTALIAYRLARNVSRTLERLDDELPATLRQARGAAEEVALTVAEARPRLERLDRLADEAEETLVTLRGTLAATQSIVRGPADVVEGARRTVQTVGEGIASGADRLRRRLAGDDEAVGE
ncbi:MAG: hypothetical protein H0V04_05485 [Chloroflexi bacterium]|nr:hypothetical protein [Chloroflexota bacterium]